jgi:peroxisomal trans-2-enoyl-CoA reductase
MSTPWKSCFRDGLLEGKVALVTGGGTGIGLSIATELASLGAIVVIASRNRQTCQEAADRMNATQVSGKIVAGPSTSIRKEDEVRNLIAWVLESFDALHLLVNNAGGQFISAAEDISKGGFSAVVETNLTGTFLVCREAFTQYMDKHGGAIVNITLGNRNGMPMMSHSGASRAGVENLTATLSTEWMGSNVRVNCVRPGIIWTESGFENYGPAGEMFVERLLPAMPARRFGSPEEVSSAVVWLLSEGASYVTGTVLNVDGASAYTLLPLRDIEDKEHLPFYGTLPRKARL